MHKGWAADTVIDMLEVLVAVEAGADCIVDKGVARGSSAGSYMQLKHSTPVGIHWTAGRLVH